MAGDSQNSASHQLAAPSRPSAQLLRAQLAAFKAKYTQRYPEAVRSLAEDEDYLLTFYAFPASLHRHIQTTNAIESLFSNVRLRTDQIDVFTTETSWPISVFLTKRYDVPDN
jgi:putative transposase